MDPQTFGWIATALFTLCYIPQIYKMLRTGSVRGVSFMFLLLPFIANLVALKYAVEIRQDPLVIKYILGALFSASCITMYVYVRYQQFPPMLPPPRDL